jgi:ABC-type multidrug transport system fused ATPase/permease subunit
MINTIINLFKSNNTTNSYKSYELVDTESNNNLVKDSINDSTNDSINDSIPSMYKLCLDMFAHNISSNLIFNMCINIVFSSLLIPLIFKIANDKFITTKNIYSGIFFVISAIACEIVSIIHKNIAIEPLKREFISNVHFELEDVVNRSINASNWNILRELNKNELDQKKSMAKWHILGFISSIISTFISMFSFFGYTFWVGWISPTSLCIYIILLSVLTIYYPHKQKMSKDIYHEIWNRYGNLQTNMYTDIIHHKGENTLNEMKHCMLTIEKNRDEDKRNDSNFTDTISVVFNIAFIINCIIITNAILNTTDIIIYIQYSFLMRNSITMCISLYNQYIDSKREYEKLKEIINNSEKKKELDQIYDFDNIEIKHLLYEYPNINSINTPFKLILEEKLNFRLGEIIRLDGNSGNGKSTFSDIINGIIPFSEYESEILLCSHHPETNSNDIKPILGFDVITKSRYYNEQQEAIGWKPSIYEIITGKNIKYMSDTSNKSDISSMLTDLTKLTDVADVIDLVDEDIVWKALQMTMCLDFVKRNNIQNELKWIHTKNVGLSGGQKGRIALARSIYRIMFNKPKIITLDEVDKAIQANLVTQIMSNIYSFTKSNNILVFVICHSPDVQQLNVYDKILSFNQGKISSLKNLD